MSSISTKMGSSTIMDNKWNGRIVKQRPWTGKRIIGRPYRSYQYWLSLEQLQRKKEEPERGKKKICNHNSQNLRI